MCHLRMAGKEPSQLRPFISRSSQRVDHHHHHDWWNRFIPEAGILSSFSEKEEDICINTNCWCIREYGFLRWGSNGEEEEEERLFCRWGSFHDFCCCAQRTLLFCFHERFHKRVGLQGWNGPWWSTTTTTWACVPLFRTRHVAITRHSSIDMCGRGTMDLFGCFVWWTRILGSKKGTKVCWHGTHGFLAVNGAWSMVTHYQVLLSGLYQGTGTMDARRWWRCGWSESLPTTLVATQTWSVAFETATTQLFIPLSSLMHLTACYP